MPEIYTLVGLIHPAACGPVEGVQFLVFSPSNEENLKNGLEADLNYYFAICAKDTLYWPSGWYEISFSINTDGKTLHLPIQYSPRDINWIVLPCTNINLMNGSIKFIDFSNKK